KAGWRTSLAARRQSSKRRRTMRTPRSWRTSRPGSALRWWASRPARSPRASASRSAAGSSFMEERARIGGLGLQGAFREHARTLRELGADVVEVRLPEELEGLDGLVIPGGESTTMTRLAVIYGLDDAIRRFEGAVFGTCAGMILVDRERLGLID